MTIGKLLSISFMSIVAIAPLCISTSGQASGVDSGIVTEISFTTTLPSSLNSAFVKASLDAKRQSMSSLEMRLGTAQIPIPAKAFQDLSKPRLETLRLRYSRAPVTDPNWYAVLSFEYGDIVCDFGAGECEEDKDWFSSVEIEIKQGRAVGRTIFRAEGKGSSSFEEL